jgi:hypothetical protein
VVAPGSEGYEWIIAPEKGIAPLPRHILDILMKCNLHGQTVTGAVVKMDKTTTGGRKLLNTALEAIRVAKEGERNETLNAQAFWIFRVVAGGYINEEEAKMHLRTTAVGTVGLPPYEVERTLVSAEAGLALPVYLPGLSGELYTKVCDEKGKIYKTLESYVDVLTNHPHWKDILRFNERAGIEELLAPMPIMDSPQPGPVTDNMAFCLRQWLQSAYGVLITKDLSFALLERVVQRNTYDPVREYLDNLPAWDKKPRLETLFPSVFGTTDTPYVRAVTRTWFYGAVARTMEPGCAFDQVLILEGVQGLGKTTFFQMLTSGVEYSAMTVELPTDLEGKDTLMRLHGPWIVELGELKVMSKATVEHIKSFLSVRIDSLRLPFNRKVVHKPRRCVFAGTTNQGKWLSDTTGGRRFWPIKCQGKLTREWLMENRDQLWAEALAGYQQGGKLWLDAATEEMARCEQALREEEDPIFEQFLDELDKLDIMENTIVTWATIAQWVLIPLERIPRRTRELIKGELARRKMHYGIQEERIGGKVVRFRGFKRRRSV